MSRVMQVVGGQWQLHLAQKIKAEGHELLISSLYPEAPALALADQVLLADALDIASHLQAARAFGAEAIVSDQSDIALDTVAALCAELKLPGPSPEQAQLFTQKGLMRQFCRQHGFPTPDFQLCRSLPEAEAFRQSKQQPLIIKPNNSQASRGVTIVSSAAELAAAFPTCLGFAHGERAVVVEEILEGVEFTVDGIFYQGQHRSLAISRKQHFAHNQQISSQLYFSPSDPEFDYDLLRQENDSLMNLTGKESGLTHNEYIFHQGRFTLVEMAARGGGSAISSLIVPAQSGLDNYALYLDQALGRPLAPWESYLRAERWPCALLDFLDCCDFPHLRGRRAVGVQGLEELRQKPQLKLLGLNVKFPYVFSEAHDDSQRLAYCIMVGEQWASIAELAQQLRQGLRFILAD